jgi:hypothetical protein
MVLEIDFLRLLGLGLGLGLGLFSELKENDDKPTPMRNILLPIGIHLRNGYCSSFFQRGIVFFFDFFPHPFLHLSVPESIISRK